MNSQSILVFTQSIRLQTMPDQDIMIFGRPDQSHHTLWFGTLSVVNLISSWRASYFHANANIANAQDEQISGSIYCPKTKFYAYKNTQLQRNRS